jgi:hypothetical protein
MTFLRKIAMATSECVVRWAAPGCKDWAEGLAREVEFIDSDWRALVWALGSVRVLFRNPPTSLHNAAEIARAGRIYAGSREHTPPVLFLLMVMQALDSGLKVVLPTARLGHLGRVGCTIATVSAVYLAVVAWMESRMSERPEDMDDGAWIEFYRREMVRRRNLFSRFGALFPSAAVLMFAGMALGDRGTTALFLASCIIAFLLLVWLSSTHGPAERIQRKIDDMDSILQQGGREA